MSVARGGATADRAAALGVVADGRVAVAATGAADLELHDRPLDQAFAGPGQEREVDRGGVAAHAAGALGALQALAVQLGQAVDEAVQPLRGGVVLAVPLAVGG